MRWFLYAIFSSLFAALVAIFGKLGLKNADSVLATTIRGVIMAIFLLVTSFFLKKFSLNNFNSLSWRDWVLIVAAGLAGALSWIFYFLALKEGMASKVAAIDRTSIIFVIILSVLILGEKISWKAFLGAILMAAGAIMVIL
ncbi:MAG: EamA family transporter [Patescibacteria group bacterium]|nr:EamA family transporter [Patescibacteria group bacterium]